MCDINGLGNNIKVTRRNGKKTEKLVAVKKTKRVVTTARGLNYVIIFAP